MIATFFRPQGELNWHLIINWSGLGEFWWHVTNESGVRLVLEELVKSPDCYMKPGTNPPPLLQQRLFLQNTKKDKTEAFNHLQMVESSPFLRFLYFGKIVSHLHYCGSYYHDLGHVYKLPCKSLIFVKFAILNRICIVWHTTQGNVLL